jgi:rRNA biogenesis protein RRP5
VGWVAAIEQAGLWLTLSPGIQGRVHVFETSQNPEQLSVPLEERFSMGQALQAVVKAVDLRRKQLSLSIRPDRISQGVNNPADAAAKAAAAVGEPAEVDPEAEGGGSSGSSKRRLPPAGQLITGKISKILGAGVVIELTKTLKGIVALTDLHDGWVSNALAGLNPGQFVRARVLGAADMSAAADAAAAAGQQQQQPLIDRHGHLLLSLKPSDGGAVAGVEGWGVDDACAASQQQCKKKQKQQQQQQASSSSFVDLESLKHGSKVQGYVRGVSDKGLFLSLDRLHHGRVKKNQLSDGFIEDPAAAFPIGTLLTARVLSMQQAAKPQEGDAAGGPAAAAAASAGRWSGRVLGDDGTRVELTLLSGELSGLRQIEEFKEGELTRGKVRGLPRCPWLKPHRVVLQKITTLNGWL